VSGCEKLHPKGGCMAVRSLDSVLPWLSPLKFVNLHLSNLFLRWAKYFYMTCVPMHNELKWPRLEPTAGDFTTSMALAGRDLVRGEDARPGKVFKVPKSLTLPKSLDFTVKQLRQVERSAGTLANQRSAAATAWILSNSTSGFEHAPMAWTGLVEFGLVFG
jgi:hypothetical protein